MSFIISKKKTEDKIQHIIKYDETEWYYTKNTESQEEGWENERNIIEKYSIIVPSESFDIWLDAVLEFIKQYNSKLPAQTVTYEILDKREDGQYKYIKKLNNQNYEEGVSDYFDIPEDELDAWETSVEKYHRDNNIPFATDELEKNADGATDKMDPGKTLYNVGNCKMPTIPGALGKITSDPCNFPSELIGGIKRGPVSPKDKIKETYNEVRSKFDTDLRLSIDDPALALKPMMQPVIDTVKKQIKDLKDINISYESFRKKYASVITDTEYLLEQNLDEIEDEAFVTESDDYEIPEDVLAYIETCMKTKFGKDGKPSDKIVKRYEDNKDFIINIFKSYNIPEQLSLICIIESNVVNISKENIATAKGMWQITRITGAEYGLLEIKLKPGITSSTSNKDYDVVSKYDKRDDFEESTKAAARILSDIKKQRSNINKWIFVAAAYNMGGGGISRKIKKAGENTSVWEIWKTLPEETKKYIALLIGLCKFFKFKLTPLFE